MSEVKFFKVTSLPDPLEPNAFYAVKNGTDSFELNVTNSDGTVAYTSTGVVIVDSVPTDGSGNAVSSNGVFDALALKQDYDEETTIAGNTFNGASQLVQLDVNGNLPAVGGENLTGLDTVLINDGDNGTSTSYSGYKTQQMHDAQAEQIANLAGASATIYSDTTQPIPEDPSAFVDMEWLHSGESTNADILELGTNSFIFKANGTYNFYSTLTFYRLSSGESGTVTFELYNSVTDAVVATYAQPIDMTAGTKMTIPMNALLTISGLAELETVNIKVRMRSSAIAGTVELFNFRSIVAIASVAGGNGGVTDHGALTGLADDDHTQYHNDARGDARYVAIGTTYDKADVGLGNVDNTADADKNVLSATKFATSRTINGVSFDGTANIEVEDRKGSNIASASTITIGTAGLGELIHVTGTDGITSLGTATSAGIRRTLVFDGELTITHNATSLICLGGANITTVAGTVLEVVAETTSNWRVLSMSHTSVSMAELGYLNGVTSSIQDQLDSKSGTITVDAVPTNGSTNPVQSDGVYDALALKLATAGGTMTGAITALRESSVAMAANNIDLTAGNVFTKTISGSTTFTISGALASGNVNSFSLRLTNAGSAAITWFSGIKWIGGAAPTLTTSGVDRLAFESLDGGTTWDQTGIAKDIR